jgi:CRISPR-associated protein Cmr2
MSREEPTRDGAGGPAPDDLWAAKLWAWTHDPAEKALILMRRPGGHEAGVGALRERIFGARAGAEGARWEAIGRAADHAAAAADRPRFPYALDDPRYPAWAQPRFADQPELIHPLGGDRILPGSFGDEVSWQEAAAASFAHLEKLVAGPKGAADLRRTALALWRFAPETPYEHLGALWPLLPADSRVPDHGIFAHLDLVSALAGAMAADPERTPALLAVSLGPVQDFVAQARSTSDLWAGSHLLSRLSWEAMKVVAEACGPDAILFPALRGLPLVDVWLRQEAGLAAEHFDGAEWTQRNSDANPLFAAALPNKFLALVPASEAEPLARKLTAAVRDWVQQEALEAAQELFDKAGRRDMGTAAAQVRAQLEGFPEVHWAVAPWSLATDAKPPDPAALQAALGLFYPHGKLPFFEEYWPLLTGALELDGHRFFQPNRGALFAPLHDLAERTLGAAKSLRDFRQLPQLGYRCTLCGEREWLSDDPELLHQHAPQDSVWSAVAANEPSWSKAGGERLCALCTLKRLWPHRFAARVREITGGDPRRYNVSTHMMAVAPILARAAADSELRAAIDALVGASQAEPAALPRRLARPVAKKQPPEAARRLPEWLAAGDVPEADAEAERRRRRGQVNDRLGAPPEAYFALALLDGDRMGQWISGDGLTLPFAASWHSQVAQEMQQRAGGNPDIAHLCRQPRPSSPARQMAISEALNHFSLRLAPRVVEDWHDGKLLYAGGDDVLAMLPVVEALPAVFTLRLLYSGVMPGGENGAAALAARIPERPVIKAQKGFVLDCDRLLRLMGPRASLSGGVVIAHHQAPLGAVLRSLRAAEAAAKATARGSDGEPAFPAGVLAVRLVKRAGGETELLLPWWPGKAEEPPAMAQTGPGLLLAWADRLGPEGALSRRFVYHLQVRLAHAPGRLDLGDAEFRELLIASLAYQARRQSDDGGEVPAELVAATVEYALATAPPPAAGQRDPALQRLEDFLTVAEFLAREGRFGRLPQQKLAAEAASR